MLPHGQYGITLDPSERLPVSDKPLTHGNVVCEVDPPEDEFGEFSNAFRYILDGSEVLLDFCLYSEREQKARVVSRVRISQALFSVIYHQLGSGLAPISGPHLTLYPIPGES